MKRMLMIALLLTGFVLQLPAQGAPQTGDLAQNFASPPPSARAWVYWFWSDGNLTREGITADLEAMKAAGIGGVLIMEVDQGPPKGPARFMGAKWRELFKFMLSEAGRLGIEVNMNNDAGWCGSGGPWITPDKSMQKVVWTETVVKGPARIERALTRPEAFEDYYGDIAALAFPSPAGEGTDMNDARPRVTSNLEGNFDGAKLVDNDPATFVAFPAPERAKPYYVQVEFAQPYRARHMSLTIPVSARQGYTGTLQTSADGAKWRALAKFNQTGGGMVNFTPTQARFWRVSFSAITTTTLPRLRVCDIALDMSHRTEGFAAKAGMGVTAFDPNVKPVPAGIAIDPAKIVDLTASFKDGKLAWEAPEGSWTIVRFGHTSTGKDNHPAPEEGRGLECDKLSKAGIKQQFDGLIDRLVQDSGPECTKVMTYTHIDSWEVGLQNWTDAMREEFKKRRGYDMFPYLPAMTGRVVASAESTERFYWDLRRTISEMLNDNYATGLRELAATRGMKLSIEAYSGGPFDSYSYSGRCDMPIGEFWTGRPIHASLKPMASGGHIYGNPVVAAEAFTASNTEGRQKNHPGSIKALGDQAFCAGINRFIFHRYSAQPWVDPPRQPGMTMGPWGLEYERTATWWKQSTAWHEYLARCQYMLQQGSFQADLLYMNNEEGFQAIRGREQMTPPVPAGYDYDVCSPEVIMNLARVRNGRVALDNGMSYRVLVLPETGVMRPELVKRLRELVEAGIVVVGPRPVKSPSLVNYPECDEEVKALADALWGDVDGKKATERACARGKIYCGVPLEDVLMAQGADRDFDVQTPDPSPAFHFIHRATDSADYYFVANANARAAQALCTFRVVGRRPEIWHPDTGTIEPVAAYQAERGCVRVPIHFDPSGSVFVVFRKDAPVEKDRVLSVALNGKTVIDTKPNPAAGDAPAGDNNASVKNNFTMMAWVKPVGAIALPGQVSGGTNGLTVRGEWVVYPAPGHEVYARPGEKYALDQTCAGFAVGTNGVFVCEHGDHLMAPVLTVKTPIQGKAHIAIVYKNGVPSLFVNGKPVGKPGLKTGRNVHPATGVKHTRAVAPFKGECTGLKQIRRAITPPEIARYMRETAGDQMPGTIQPVFVTRTADGALCARMDPGQGLMGSRIINELVLKTGDGRDLKTKSPMAWKMPLAGSWEVSFPPNLGAPPKATFEKLVSWSERPEEGIKYFSGTATYKKTFDVPQSPIRNSQSAIFLDLGDVKVSARVRLNGKDLGILWKEPYRVEVTEALKPGENALEIEVVNLWINRLIGDEQLPEDSVFKIENRARGQVLAEYPKWLEEGKPSPTGRITFKTWKHYGKDDPLVPSGLIGPVTLDFEEIIAFPKR